MMFWVHVLPSIGKQNIFSLIGESGQRLEIWLPIKQATKFSGSILRPLVYLEYIPMHQYTLGQCQISLRQFDQLCLMGSGCTEKRPPNRPISCLGQPIFGFYSIARFFDHKTSIFFMNFLITHLDLHLCQPETEYHSVALFYAHPTLDTT